MLRLRNILLLALVLVSLPACKQTVTARTPDPSVPQPGVYSLAEVPSITEVDEGQYWAWFHRRAVTDRTLAFVHAHREAMDLAWDVVTEAVAELPGCSVEGRSVPVGQSGPGLKSTHKVEEKIYRMLLESNRHWADFDEGNRDKGGAFPRGATPEEARATVFAADPAATNAIRDIAALRTICPELTDVREVEKRLRTMWVKQLLRFKDFIGIDYRHDGYRSVHLVVLVEGKAVEIQIRTANQHRWADWEHDLIYKGRFKNDDEVKAYALRVAEVLHQRDLEECPAPCPLPTCPVVLDEASSCYVE